MLIEDNPEMFEPVKTWADAAERLLSVAEQTVNTRDEQYGECYSHHATTARMWSAFKGVRFDPDEVSMMFILDKIVRSINQAKPDNLLDVAGYALVHARVQAELERAEHIQSLMEGHPK